MGKDTERYGLDKIPDEIIIKSMREEIIFLEKRIENQKAIIDSMERDLIELKVIRQNLSYWFTKGMHTTIQKRLKKLGINID